MLTVMSLAMVEVMVDGSDRSDCCGVDGVTSRDDKVDGSSDLGGGGGAG